jgi:hypothetical protein
MAVMKSELIEMAQGVVKILKQTACICVLEFLLTEADFGQVSSSFYKSTYLIGK